MQKEKIKVFLKRVNDYFMPKEKENFWENIKEIFKTFLRRLVFYVLFCISLLIILYLTAHLMIFFS